MKALHDYISQRNQWGGFYGHPGPIKFGKMNQKDINAIAEALDCDFSPENLHCDGEISNAEAGRKANRLGRVMDQLESYCTANGFNMPTIYEAW